MFHNPFCVMKRPTSNSSLNPLHSSCDSSVFVFNFPSLRIFIWPPFLLQAWGFFSTSFRTLWCLCFLACNGWSTSPHQDLAIWMHSSHHAVPSQMRLAPYFQLVVGVLFLQSWTSKYPWHFHIITASSISHAAICVCCRMQTPACDAS